MKYNAQACLFFLPVLKQWGWLCRIDDQWVQGGMNAHLFKDYLTDNPHCLHCSYEFEGNVHYFLECPKYIQQRDILLQQFCDIGVPFYIYFIQNVQSIHIILIVKLFPMFIITVNLLGASEIFDTFLLLLWLIFFSLFFQWAWLIDLY